MGLSCRLSLNEGLIGIKINSFTLIYHEYPTCDLSIAFLTKKLAIHGIFTTSNSNISDMNCIAHIPIAQGLEDNLNYLYTVLPSAIFLASLMQGLH